MKPRVKICCISSKEEAFAAIGLGASALGLVGSMPSGPGVISDRKIYEIAREIPPPIATFLLTSATRADDIINHHHKTKTNTIQIVDTLEDADYRSIREALPITKIVQVVHVLDESAVDEVLRVEEHVDAILLDSGNPNLEVNVLGGTGKTHDWDLSRKIVELCKRPIFLAGGLGAANIAEAVKAVDPFGVDLCSGVRTNGRLDFSKLKRFFQAIATT